VGAPGLAVEIATWRPVEVLDVDGWQVGLSGGFTRRGNSVAAVDAPAKAPAALDRVESIYAGRGQRPVFRVCGQSAPAGLEGMLESRGYAAVAPTAVMAARLAGVDPGPPDVGPAHPGASVRITSRPEPDVPWLRGWLDVKASSEVDLDLAARLLAGPPARYLAAIDDGSGAPPGEVLGVIRVALAHGWAALSCLTVRPRARRRGLGAALTRTAPSSRWRSRTSRPSSSTRGWGSRWSTATTTGSADRAAPRAAR
jgi:GNAT superfamily N-acetyltransferase